MKKLVHYALGLFASTAIIAGGGEALAVSLTLDTFDVDQGPLVVLPIPPTFPSDGEVGPDVTILGGFRDLEATGNGVFPFATTLTVTSGSLSLSNTVNTTGTATATWDGQGDQGLGGVDVTLNGVLDALAIDLISSDLPGLTLEVSVSDQTNSSSSLVRTFNAPVPQPTRELFNFADFVGSADFTDVDSIQLVISGPPEIDAAIALVEFTTTTPPVTSVPEPTTLFGTLVALGFGIARKRKLLVSEVVKT